MQDGFEALQLGRVLDEVAPYAHSEQGRKAVLSLRPLEPKEREKEALFLGYADELINLGGPLPINPSRDLAERVDVSRKGGTLSEEDFAGVLSDLNGLKDIKKHLAHVTLSNPLIDRVNGLNELEPLRQGILRVLKEDLSIKDSASVELKRIRSTLERKRREIVSRLGALLEEHRPYLSGNSWTMRNGHYVLPISNTYKHQVKGLVQDVSSSGGTTFIEPEFLVKLQNDVALLLAEEKEEIRRILAALSRLLGQNAKDFLLINEAIGYLDFLQAKVLYGRQINGHQASESIDGSLFLPGARHPLIDPKKVVANDFALSASRRVLVLSGPNAGGKTVALKTLGTLAYMHAMALPLPVKQGAEMPRIGHVLVDIGDSQSILDNLSTFSGHVNNIKAILELAQKGDLVLLDEVGTGTSPQEGEALALAILDRLREKGCYALISSHFERLKAVALSSEDVENASLLFDEATLTPTYVLRVGLPGESYGLEVARRLGLDEATIAKAEAYLREGEDLSVSSSLRHLGELTLAAEEKAKALEEEKRQLATQQAELKKQQEELKRRLSHFEEDSRKEKAELLAKAQQQIDEAMKALSGAKPKLHEAIAAKKALEEMEEKQTRQRYDEDVQVGDYVELPAYGVEGRVSKVRGKNAVEVVSREGFTFNTSMDQLRKIDAPEEKKRSELSGSIDALPSPGMALEVNLIGMRVAEAMAELDSYLDRCRLKGFKRVRVIHGLGSGALRRATHEYLKAHSSFVEKFELAGEYEGGGGATVVYLK